MRAINLSQGLSMYDDRTTFPLGDLEICVNNLPRTTGDFRLIAFMNKAKIGEYTLARDHAYIYILRKDLTAGVFTCYVSHYINGEEIRRYEIEPLVISALNDDLSATPEIAAVNAKLETLNEQAGKLAERLTEQITQLTEAKTIITGILQKQAKTNAAVLAILKWAYGVENEVPYFEDGSVEQFADKLGVELSADEIKIIGGLTNEY